MDKTALWISVSLDRLTAEMTIIASNIEQIFFV